MDGELQHWMGSYSTGWGVTAQQMVSYITPDGDSTWMGQINSGTAAGRSGNTFEQNKSNREHQ